MQELAERMNPETTASTINKLEKGQMNLTQGWMMRLAEALGIEQRDLLSQGAGIAAGLYNNVKPYIPGPRDALMAAPGTTLFTPTNNDLDDHPKGIGAGAILVIKTTVTDTKDLTAGQVCVFDLYDKSAKPKPKGQIIGQFLPNNKLISNSKSANWIINLDDENLLFTPRLRGVMIHIATRPDA